MDRKHIKILIIDGMSKTLDIGNTYKRRRMTSNSFRTDRKIMSSDWANVGNDLKKAIKVASINE